MIPLSQPDITDLERTHVLEVLNTPYLSLGPKLPEFEKIVADYVGTKYAIAMNSGTSALHCCVKILSSAPDDEVITTPFSFIATSNCILFENAKPVFVDIDMNTYNIDTALIEKSVTEKTKAILPVHVFGVPAEMHKIKQIAKKYNLKIIEDAAEALGAEYHNTKVGNLGDCGVFAFYPNKQITTGEGGIVVTDDKEIDRICRSLRNQGRGKSKDWLQHERMGYNYRLSDINCALGIAQMERINEILEKRKQVAEWYINELKSVDEIQIQATPQNSKRSWFVFVIQLNKRFSIKDRNDILYHLRKAGVSCSDYFSPIHLQPFMVEKFGFKQGDFPNCEKISSRTIALPFYSNLSKSNISFVVDNLKRILLKY